MTTPEQIERCPHGVDLRRGCGECDPIWEATVRGELDEPLTDLGYHPGED